MLNNSYQTLHNDNQTLFAQIQEKQKLFEELTQKERTKKQKVCRVSKIPSSNHLWRFFNLTISSQATNLMVGHHLWRSILSTIFSFYKLKNHTQKHSSTGDVRPLNCGLSSTDDILSLFLNFVRWYFF